MKKKIIAVSLVVAMLFTGLTIAYFTDEKEVDNVFTYGDVSVEIVESGWEDNEKYDEKADALVNVFPGETFNKKPFIRNTGTNEAYIRMGVKVDRALLLAMTGKDDLGQDDTLLRELVDLNDQPWKYVGRTENNDGTVTFWYMYDDNDGKLAAGAESAHLFTTVTIPKDYTGDKMPANRSFTLTVISQAVQTATFNSAEAAFEAAFGDN